jgi:hypothetical protein
MRTEAAKTATSSVDAGTGITGASRRSSGASIEPSSEYHGWRDGCEDRYERTSGGCSGRQPTTRSGDVKVDPALAAGITVLPDGTPRPLAPRSSASRRLVTTA